jgi:hypothetical protein
MPHASWHTRQAVPAHVGVYAALDDLTVFNDEDLVRSEDYRETNHPIVCSENLAIAGLQCNSWRKFFGEP